MLLKSTSHNQADKAKLSRPKKIVLQRSAASAAAQVLTYKATNIVLQLKQRLDKKDMLELKLALKTYKERADIKCIIAVLKAFCESGKLSNEEVCQFKDYVKHEDLTEFTEFTASMSKPH